MADSDQRNRLRRLVGELARERRALDQGLSEARPLLEGLDQTHARLAADLDAFGAFLQAVAD